MRYIIYLKNEVAMAKSIRMDSENIPLGNFDTFAEVDKEVYTSIKIPAKLVDGNWETISDLAEIPRIAPNSIEENATQPVTVEERLEALEAAMLEMALKEVEE